MIFRKKLTPNLSDKALLSVFVLATIALLAIKFILGGDILQILIIGNILYVTAFIITFLANKKLSKRIVSLTFKVEEMAAGNLSKRIKSDGNDEIGQLTNALDELMTRLQTGVAIDVSKQREIAQAKTDFVSTASHQLRTPLSIVKWYVDYLINGDAGEISDEQKKYLEEVYRSNERLIDLVNALLDVSRIDMGTFSIEPEPTDIIKRFESAIQKYSTPIKEKELNVEEEYDKEVPLINVDPKLTQIVFETIVSNSIKYTPAKGTIHVIIKKTEKDVLIKISDTGCGIARENHPKIFTKFFRATNVKKIEASGTGLGLYIAKAVIEKSGGKIWFESPSLDAILSESKKNPAIPIEKMNKGTTFFITIPLKGMKKKRGTKKLTSIE